MGGFKAFLIFLIFCGVLYFIATGGKGIQSPDVTGLLSPNPASLDAAASSSYAQGQAYANQAEQARAQLTQAAQARLDELARQTQTAGDEISRQTAVVEAQRTQDAWQVTVEAARAQDTATAQAASTAAQQTQIVVDSKATADHLVLNQSVQLQTKQAELDQIELRNKQVQAQVAYQTRYWPVVAGVVLTLIVIVAGAWLLKMKDDVNLKTLPRNADGESETAFAKGKFFVPDLAVAPVTDPKQPVLPAGDRQHQVALMRFAVQAIRGLTRAGQSRAARQAAESFTQQAGPVLGQNTTAGQPSSDTEEKLPLVAPWEALGNWTGERLALGVEMGRRGITVDSERVPHLFFAGSSGSGKTMAGLRPLAMMGLASNWQVVLINTRAADFDPMATHPNLIKIPRSPEEILQAVEAAAGEIDRRSDVMEDLRVTTWFRHPEAMRDIGPRLMIIVDELVSLAWRLETKQRARFWAAVIKITSEGRKEGVSFIGATTDPTYKTLGREGLVVRADCGRVAFMLRDREASHAILRDHSAQALEGNQFIAQLDGNVVRGAAFHPEDDQIVSFLKGHPVLALPDPDWMGRPAPSQATPTAAPNPEKERAQRIRDLAGEGKSLNEIQREIFGFTGGAAYTAVKGVLGDSASTTTTTQSASTTTPLPAD